MALTKLRVRGSTALVEATLACRCCRMNRRAPSTICRRGTVAFRYIRSMDSTSKVTCLSNTSATVCGSFDFGSVCGVPLRLGESPYGGPIHGGDLPPSISCTQVEPTYMLVGLGRSPVSVKSKRKSVSGLALPESCTAPEVEAEI